MFSSYRLVSYNFTINGRGITLLLPDDIIGVLLLYSEFLLLEIDLFKNAPFLILRQT